MSVLQAAHRVSPSAPGGMALGASTVKLAILALVLAADLLALWVLWLRRDRLPASYPLSIEEANRHSRRVHDPALVHRDDYLDRLAEQQGA